MKVHFWGSQGSYPSPMSNRTLRGKIREVLQRVVVSDLVSDESIVRFLNSLPFHLTHTYGGNTSSVSVLSDDSIFIIDAGTGIIPLGKEFAKKHLLKTTDTVNLFITHTHWDHIQGFPFFAPIFMKGVKINIYSPMSHMKKRFDGQHMPQYLPFKLEQMPAEINFHKLDVNTPIEINGHKISTAKEYHPGGSYAYRIDKDDKSFGHTGDTELNVNSVEYFDKSAKFFKDVDLLVCDTQYLVAEAYQKLDWGHSTTSTMLDLCVKAKVKKMVISHHEPNYGDEAIYEIHKKTKKYLKMLNEENLEVLVAYEGLNVEI